VIKIFKNIAKELKDNPSSIEKMEHVGSTSIPVMCGEENN
jgi:GrpB-like predicted nucleotidyltransferase (UPF0157 family)